MGQAWEWIKVWYWVCWRTDRCDGEWDGGQTGAMVSGMGYMCAMVSGMGYMCAMVSGMVDMYEMVTGMVDRCGGE